MHQNTRTRIAIVQDLTKPLPSFRRMPESMLGFQTKLW